MVRSAKVLWCSALLLLIALMLSMVGCAMVVCGLVVYGVGWPCSYRYVPTSSTSASIEHGWTSRSREINSREIRCRCGMLHQGSRVPRSPAAAPASANPSVDHRAAAWRTIPLSPWAIPFPPPLLVLVHCYYTMAHHDIQLPHKVLHVLCQKTQADLGKSFPVCPREANSPWLVT